MDEDKAVAHKEHVMAAVVGGALIRVVLPSGGFHFRPYAHNHMFIVVLVRELRPLCVCTFAS